LNQIPKLKIFQSDNGREFCNTLIEDLLRENRIEFIHGAPYTPRHQGVIERFNRTINRSMKKGINGNPRWISALDKCVSVYYSTHHCAHKMTPKTNSKCIRMLLVNKNDYRRVFDAFFLILRFLKCFLAGIHQEIRGTSVLFH